MNYRRAHGVSLGFGARRSISRQYKYANDTFPDWRMWTKLVRATYGVANVRIAQAWLAWLCVCALDSFVCVK